MLWKYTQKWWWLDYGKASGGVLVLVRKTIVSKFKVKQIFKHYKHMVFLKCECAENQNTIIMGFLYIPPENSIFYNSQTTNNGIDILEEALFEIESNFEDHKLLLAGDFNSRRAELEDFMKLCSRITIYYKWWSWFKIKYSSV